MVPVHERLGEHDARLAAGRGHRVDVFDRERGWGRRGETFRATEELRRFDPELAWFNLGDLDLATHLFRTRLLREGRTLSQVTALVAARFGVASRVLPMSDDPVTTRVEVLADGGELDLHFQEYWVRRHARDEVKHVRYAGAEAARPGPGVLEALREAARPEAPPRVPPRRGSSKKGQTTVEDF